MDERFRPFWQRDPYRTEGTERLFFDAVRRQLHFHIEHCPAYAEILSRRGFCEEQLQSEADLWKIPVLPTLYFKRNRLFSLPEDRLCVKASSSGTKGAQSLVGFDKKTLACGIGMMVRFFARHRILSPIPVNYIVLGYEPSKHTQMGAVKTAYGTTFFAPALHRAYALRDTGKGYAPNLDGVLQSLLRYAKSPFPVRFVGFAPYLYFLMQLMEEQGLSLRLPKRSMILLGGGWKQFTGEQIDRAQLLALAQKTLGIGAHRCMEFYSAVEHPLPYLKCTCGNFHIPAYSRVIVRDVQTLLPVENGTQGLLSFVSPLVGSMPLLSVVTDDLAVLSDTPCACGLKAPHFRLNGRAGVRQIKTCAADAAELLGG